MKTSSCWGDVKLHKRSSTGKDGWVPVSHYYPEGDYSYFRALFNRATDWPARRRVITEVCKVWIRTSQSSEACRFMDKAKERAEQIRSGRGPDWRLIDSATSNCCGVGLADVLPLKRGPYPGGVVPPGVTCLMYHVVARLVDEGWTQLRIGTALGVSTDAVGKWGERKPEPQPDNYPRGLMLFEQRGFLPEARCCISASQGA